MRTVSVKSARLIGTSRDSGLGTWGLGIRWLPNLESRIPCLPPALLRSIADIAAGDSGPLAIIACTADFGADATGHAFCDVARSRMFRPIVAGSAFHRLLVLFAHLARSRHTIPRSRSGIDIAE